MTKDFEIEYIGIGYLRQNRSVPAWHVFQHGRSHLHLRHPGEGEDDDYDDGKKYENYDDFVYHGSLIQLYCSV